MSLTCMLNCSRSSLKYFFCRHTWFQQERDKGDEKFTDQSFSIGGGKEGTNHPNSLPLK